MESVVFYIFALVLLGLGLLVITRTNPIASALAMVGAFAALAGLYVLLSAEFVAVVQVLVYAGGIMVLVLFVIMLLNLHEDDLRRLKPKIPIVALAFLGSASMFLSPLLSMGFPSRDLKNALIPPDFGGLFSVGEKIFSVYLFPFEMLSLLLLTAIVGAVVLAKKRL